MRSVRASRPTVEAERKLSVVSVLVVEPAPVTALALQVVLADMGEGVSVSVVHSVDSAMQYVRSAGADLVITDLGLPTNAEGVSFCRWLQSVAPGLLVLVFSSERGPTWHSAAVSSGVCGYVHKSVSVKDFRQAVKGVLDGKPMWWLAAAAESEADDLADLPDGFSRREREVHSLLLQRFTNAEIAKELHLAEQTVKNYVSSVLRKLGLKGRFDLFA